jgi:predicted RNase H-like nuclease (RuvC/YqgF family)
MRERDNDVRRLVYRIRQLPKQLERARHRVRQLEEEARQLGFYDLLEFIGEEK